MGSMHIATLKQAFVQEGMHKLLTTLHENVITHGHISFHAFHFVVVNKNSLLNVTDFVDAPYHPKHTTEFAIQCESDMRRLVEIWHKRFTEVWVMSEEEEVSPFRSKK